MVAGMASADAFSSILGLREMLGFIADFDASGTCTREYTAVEWERWHQGLPLLAMANVGHAACRARELPCPPFRI